MIISRTPFRVSFVGGGSDLPAFCDRLTDALVAAHIDAYRVFGFVNGAVSVGASCGPGDTQEAAGCRVDALGDGIPGVHLGGRPAGLRGLEGALSEALDPRGTFSLVHRLWSTGGGR